MRHIYVIEATAKPRSALGGDVITPTRILYIDSEGWFITASDQFNDKGQLWKTIATFHTYRDRPTLQSSVSHLSFQTHIRDGAG